jgi:hypothetical protein
VGDAADVTEVHTASIFKVEVCRLVSFCVYISFCFKKESGKGYRVVIGASYSPVGTPDLKPTHSDPEYGGSMYLRNVGKIAHNHTMQKPKNKININT